MRCGAISAASGTTSDRDVEAHFQHPVMWEFEEVGSPARDPGEKRVNRERHRRHGRLPCAADHDFVRDVIMHLVKIDLEAMHLTTLERYRNVRALHEAEPILDAIDAVAERFDVMALCERDPRPPVSN